MRIGISVCSAYPNGDPKTSVRHMIERVRAARRADLDSLFVGDHHVTSRPYFQNSPVLGRLLAEWNNKPAGALYLLPLWNPVLLAEQIGTLASIMQGRFILQCSLGGEKRQSEGMGVEFSKRVGMFEESLRLIKALLVGEQVSSRDYWAINDAKISPVPDLEVEIWIGSQANVAINRAARLADGWLATPSIEIEEASIDGVLSTYRVYVTTPGAGDFVSAISGDENNPSFLRTTTSFSQSSVGGLTADAINPAFFGLFPDLATDSWLTIGIDQAPASGEGSISTAVANIDFS